jgi:ABC-2 type transport system permease protein
VITLLTLYMPALIFVNGKVSFGHIAAGYTGLLLVGAASTAVGTFGSSLVRSQLVAAVIAAVILLFFTISWLLGRIVDPPLDDIVSYFSLYDRHFLNSFGKGRINTEDIAYYLSITFVFLLLSVRVLASRRWK